MEELFKELSTFAKENRKALKPAEQWLNEFDGNLDDAWNVVRNSTHIDWRKIVLVVKRIYDCGVVYLLNVILAGEYYTKEHPSIVFIRSALEEGKKAVAEKKTNPVPETASLEIFIETYCKEFGVIRSKVKTLQKYARKRTIKLPRLAVKWKRGQAKLYYINDLISNWSKYKQIMPTLPELNHKK